MSQKVELPEESREVFCVPMSVVISEESASGQRLIREQSSSQFQFFGLLTGQMCVPRSDQRIGAKGSLFIYLRGGF